MVPTKFGQVHNLNTLSDKYGKQIENWNGVDVTVNARLQNGLTLQGGVSTGKTMEDNCEIVAKLPEMQQHQAARRRRRTPHRRCPRHGARRSSATASRRS